MNIVFWVGVAIVAFGLWYFISKHFFRIGEDVSTMINNIKYEIKKENDEQEEDENE